MSLFDDLFDLPGKIVETAVETVIRLPVEGTIGILGGAVKGVESGVSKIDDAMEKLLK